MEKSLAKPLRTSNRLEWWSRADQKYVAGEFFFAGQSAQELARQFGTPTFFYSARRIHENIKRIQSALDQAGLAHRFQINFAMKANRFVPLLCHLQQSGLVGIDACSPNEVELAISCGFSASQISFTNTSLSRDDLERLSRWKNLRINCDSINTIRRWGELGRNRTIGIRINPACGVSRAQNDKLQYAGTETTKFGIYREQFLEALATAKKFNLTIDTIHFHTGCGYLTPQLDRWQEILESCQWFVDQADTLKFVNVGGGLGVPHVATDEPLDLNRWASILQKHYGHLKSLTIEMEPGDYITKDAGILLLTVNSVELKKDTTFVGVNGGFNIAVEPVVYGLPFQPVPALVRSGSPETYTIAGNINEALDVWYRNIDLSPLAEDDVLVFLNAGAYSSSMASNHCMRGDFNEFLLT